MVFPQLHKPAACPDSYDYMSRIYLKQEFFFNPD